ncbi:MAG: M16 family metallopeptidase [Bacteroidales bacterium]
MKKLSILFISIGLLVLISCNKKADELNINYEKYTLANGLDVILHVDKSDPIVAFAVQYHVGSNREVPGRTGFAHLFEHMMFQRSENVAEDQFFKLIQNAGGTLNGGTGNDATTYYEVVPKNALEMILWMEADRMGYMINTVTKKSFAIQQNVVQNEKRQMVDNRPYGHTSDVLSKALYPKDHPYNWQVIGEMEDLFHATIDDVKQFHKKFYVPNNATIVLAGDFEIEEAKKLIEKYYGEIPRGEELTDPTPQHVALEQTKKLYHEDNFARAAQLTMVWPTTEQFSKDSYALQYLAQLLSQGKKAPIYQILEKEKKLTSRQYAYNGAQEITGEFTISVTANEGISLNDIEKSIFEAFARFEEKGITDDDLLRIKASLETDFYNGISSVLGKSFQLAFYNEYAGSPSFYKNDIDGLKSVTKEDIVLVYNKYIKDKPYVAASFVPKGQVNLIAEGSVLADIKEEDILNATEVKIEEVEEEIAKTPSAFDRSIQPALGTDPALTVPSVWETKLANGIKVLGIEQNELPLIRYNITIAGGQYLDKIDKPGVANLVTSIMTEGTKNKTPEQLEEEIEKLGASIYMYTSSENITISVNTLARNFDKTLAIVEEILLEPRWDEEEFALAKESVINNLKRQKADPNYLARMSFNKLVYGENHIFAYDIKGNEEVVNQITIDDLKAYYEANFSPSITSMSVAGNITKEQVEKSLASIATKWQAKEVVFPEYQIPAKPEKSQIYFVDVPGAKQSVINIGTLALSRQDADYFPAYVMNYQLGGSFNGKVNIVLREEKGFTYGARTGFAAYKIPGYFSASSSVRSTATLESINIFKSIMEGYREGITAEELDFTKNALIKSYLRQFETLGALIGMLQDINVYGLPVDYIKSEENIIKNMTLEQHKEMAQKYITPDKMYYVVAGDAQTQAKDLKKVGFGEPIILKY